MSTTSEPIVGGRAAAQALSVHLANVTAVHHCHTPVIDFQDWEHATGVWAMEDNLFWTRSGEKQWLRASAYETYVRGGDGPMALYSSQTRTYARRNIPGRIRDGRGLLGENLLVGVG